MTSTENFVVEQALSELSARGDAGNAIHDGAGRIRLFFHGTRAPDDFTTFSCDGPPLDDDGFPLSEDSGPDPTAFLGAHFAEERKVAEAFALRNHDWMRRRPHVYADGQEPNPRVLAVALKIRNPAAFATEEELLGFIFRKGSLNDEGILLDVMYRKYGLEEGSAGADEWLARYDADEELRREVHTFVFLDRRASEGEDQVLREEAIDMARGARCALLEQGFDGIRYGNRVEGGTSWVAFDPAQVLRAYVDRAPGGQVAKGCRFSCETSRNDPPALFRPLPTPRGEAGCGLVTALHQ